MVMKAFVLYCFVLVVFALFVNPTQKKVIVVVVAMVTVAVDGDSDGDWWWSDDDIIAAVLQVKVVLPEQNSFWKRVMIFKKFDAQLLFVSLLLSEYNDQGANSFKKVNFAK